MFFFLWRQQRARYCLIQPDSLCLLIMGFSPLLLEVIFERCLLIPVLLQFGIVNIHIFIQLWACELLLVYTQAEEGLLCHVGDSVLTFRGIIRLTAIAAEVFCIPNKNPDSSTSFHPYIFCWHLNHIPPTNVVEYGFYDSWTLMHILWKHVYSSFLPRF